MDFQNRVGSKPGSGGVMSSQESAIERRERLKKLALETIDVKKDPYIMWNHLGQIECKLCLTIHPNEGNYLAHTQGKRHQQNLGRRAAKEAQDKQVQPQTSDTSKRTVRSTIKIGRPGYKVLKQRDPETRQRALIFEIEYPEIQKNLQPRHRFMSAFEQRKEAPDRQWQYLLFAAEPYETIAFKIPNMEVDKGEGKFQSNWDKERKVFTLQFYFRAKESNQEQQSHANGAPRLQRDAHYR